MKLMRMSAVFAKLFYYFCKLCASWAKLLEKRSKALSCICRVLNCKFIAICVETKICFFIFLGCVSHAGYYKGALY